MKPQESISIDRAAVMLGITPEKLTALCDQDSGQRYHHRTIYSNRIRFFAADIIRIRKLVPTLTEKS